MRTITIIIDGWPDHTEEMSVSKDADDLQISQMLNDEYGEDGWFCWE